MEAKIDKLVSASNQVQQVAALQSSYKRGIQAIERKLLDNMKIMQTAIIKTVTDSIGNTNPAGCSLGEATGGDSKDESRPSKGINQSDPEEDDQTPAEVADSRISKVLKDMSRLSDMHVVPGNPQVDPFTANLSESVVREESRIIEVQVRLDGVSDVPQVADMVIDTNVTANRSEDPATRDDVHAAEDVLPGGNESVLPSPCNLVLPRFLTVLLVTYLQICIEIPSFSF
ncbi:unnamed protein product [Brassica oleracea]